MPDFLPARELQEIRPYGLDERVWTGARVLERWSLRRTRVKRVALGHGLRWTARWLEIDTWDAAETLDFEPSLWRDRLESRVLTEVGELTAYQGADLPQEPLNEFDVELMLDGTRLVTDAVRCGPVQASYVVTGGGSPLVLCWTGEWDLVLAPVASLEPYVAGSLDDQVRRTELAHKRF